MLSIFIQGLLLGYGACIPLGPINILIANYALHSYKKALALGIGAMSADVTYLLLIVFGLLKLLEGSIFLKIITLLGALFLLYIAILTYQHRDQCMEEKTLQEESILKVYLKGYTLTLLNPYTVGFWLSVSTLQAKTTESPLWLLAGLILAILSWTTLMPLVIFKSKHLFSLTITRRLAIVSALILAGFALLLFIRLF